MCVCEFLTQTFENHHHHHITKRSWSEAEIQQLFSAVSKVITETAERLHISDRFRMIRKERGLGYVPEPGYRPRTEAIDEITFAIQNDVRSTIPYCAFNSNHQM
jgi:hypothetical protein